MDDTNAESNQERGCQGVKWTASICMLICRPLTKRTDSLHDMSKNICVHGLFTLFLPICSSTVRVCVYSYFYPAHDNLPTWIQRSSACLVRMWDHSQLYNGRDTGTSGDSTRRWGLVAKSSDAVRNGTKGQQQGRDDLESASTKANSKPEDNREDDVGCTAKVWILKLGQNIVTVRSYGEKAEVVSLQSRRPLCLHNVSTRVRWRALFCQLTTWRS